MMHVKLAPETIQGEDGSTIVEMLVGLCIFALMASVLAATLLQLRPMRAITEATEADNELASVCSYIESLVVDTRRLVLLNENSERRIVFEGQAQRMRFISTVRVGSTRSSLREVELSIRQRRHGLEIVQASAPRRLFAAANKDEFIVAKDLKSVHFEYLDAREPTQNGRWLREWVDVQALPRSIRITLTGIRFGREFTIERVAVLRAGHR